MSEKIGKILPPFKMQVLTNFPYIEADFDALTNYQLLCKIVEYLNNVIGNENELTIAVNNLFNYVNNYFDNLDVQDEINNKLDEMAESGQLADIIADYIELKGQLVYNSVAEMKEAENLVNGSFAKTYGFYSYNDGGGALYKIRTITNEDIVDNMTIIPLHDESLIAELLYENNIIYVDKLGAKGDGTTDDYNIFIKAIEKAQEIKGYIQLSNKSYFINSTIDLSDSTLEYGFILNIKGIDRYRTKIIFNKDLDYGIKYIGETYLNFRIENIWFSPNTIYPAKSNINLLYLLNSPYSIFKSIRLDCSNYGLYQSNCWCSKYEDITCKENNYGMYINGIQNDIVGYGDLLSFDNLYLGSNNVTAGLYLKGSVDVTINNLNAENSTQGPALILDQTKNVTINTVYLEFFENQSPIKIICSDFSKLSNIPTNIVINNINQYKGVTPLRIEACIDLTVNGIWFRNAVYNENITTLTTYPNIISIKAENIKYIHKISINGDTSLEPLSRSLPLMQPLYFNGLNYSDDFSTYNYYCRSFTRGDKSYSSGTYDKKVRLYLESGSYGSNPTATISYTSGNFYGTISASDDNIYVGKYLKINDIKYKVLRIDETTVYFDKAFNATATNQSITTYNPTYIEINQAE